MSIVVTDPVRLLADPTCPEGQRALLQLGADIAPPRDAQDRVWLGLVAAIGAPVAAGAADASAKAAATTATKVVKVGLSGTKIALIIATLATLAALAAVAALVALGRTPGGAASERAPIAATPAPSVDTPAGPPAPSQASPAQEAPVAIDMGPPRPVPGARPAARDQLRPRTAAPAPSPAARLREETTLIRDARQALRAGDAARALRLLDECRRLFPGGALVQERERLFIEALSKDGRAAEASARAAAFLRKYPDSPHAPEVRALAPETQGGIR